MRKMRPEVDNVTRYISAAAKALGKRGGKVRAKRLSAEKRRAIARKGAEARWRNRL